MAGHDALLLERAQAQRHMSQRCPESSASGFAEAQRPSARGSAVDEQRPLAGGDLGAAADRTDRFGTMVPVYRSFTQS